MLNNLLNLSPLDLVEVSSLPVIREAMSFSRQPGQSKVELPFWFYQGIHKSGAISLKSPGGCTHIVEALDICNVIHMEPLRTFALPAVNLINRLNDRNIESKYESALVLGAVRDRWGRFDYFVSFDDPDLNISPTYLAPIPASEREKLLPVTNRRRMPVAQLSYSSSWSVDAQAKKIQNYHAKKASEFIEAAMNSNNKRLSRLAALNVDN